MSSPSVDVPQHFVEDLWHREQIIAALHRYCRGLDRRDYSLLRSAYHPDAHDDHGAYKGGVDGLVEWARARHANVEQSVHLLGQCTIDRVGDVAVAETYCISHLRFATGSPVTTEMYGDSIGPGRQLVSATWWLRYVDRFERRPNWCIAERTVVLEHVDLRPAGIDAIDDSGWTMARRDSSDHVWQELARLHSNR